MAEIGPITTQPEATPEGGEICVPGPSGNADGKWAAPFCPCANPVACCKVYWCLPCAICEVAGYAGKNTCGAFWCYPCCAPFIRRAIREKHGIKGNFKEDCLCTYFCGFCVLVQMCAEKEKGTIEK